MTAPCPDALLAAIKRGQREELRLSLSTFKGRPFLSLRLWLQPESGEWIPTRKGCSVRLHEVPAVQEALAKALELAPLGESA